MTLSAIELTFVNGQTSGMFIAEENTNALASGIVVEGLVDLLLVPKWVDFCLSNGRVKEIYIYTEMFDWADAALNPSLLTTGVVFSSDPTGTCSEVNHSGWREIPTGEYIIGMKARIEKVEQIIGFNFILAKDSADEEALADFTELVITSDSTIGT